MTLGDGTSRGQVSGVSGVTGTSEVDRLRDELRAANATIDAQRREINLAASVAGSVRVRDAALRRGLDTFIGRLATAARWRLLIPQHRAALVELLERARYERARLGA